MEAGMRVFLERWGESLALRLPAELAATLDLHHGDSVDIQNREGGLLIRKAPLRPSVESLFAGRTPEAWRAEYAGSLPWEPDVGREAIED
jgi:antitoxin MazE